MMLIVSAIAIALACGSGVAAAQDLGPSPTDRVGAGVPPASAMPELLQDVGLDQRLNAQLPLNLVFKDEQGRTVRLGNYFGKRPVILVVPEVFGLHEYQKDICRRLAKAGYFGVTLDPFFRLGDLSKIADIKEVLAKANTLADQQAFADMDRVVDWAGKQKRANISKLGITGHCRGGRTVYMYTAHQPKIDAGVAWYGGLGTTPAQPLTPIDITDKINKPVLGLYAGADQGIPVEMIQRLEAGFKAFGKEKLCPIIVYPDVPHGFHADYRPSYRKEQAEDAWKKMLAWFKKNGVA